MSILDYIKNHEASSYEFTKIQGTSKNSSSKLEQGSILSKNLIELIVTLIQPEGDGLKTFLETLYKETLQEYLYNRDSTVVIQWEEILTLMLAFNVTSKIKLTSMEIEGIGKIESFYLSNNTLNISTLKEVDNGVLLDTVNVLTL